MSEVQLGKRGRLLALSASAVLALSLATLTAGCSSPAAASHPPSAPAVRLTAGDLPGSRLPRYFADIARFSGSVAGAGPLQVRSSATGRLAARQPSIQALAIAAYDSGSRLLIARQVGDGCTSRLYRAALSADGRLGRLTRLGPVIRGIVASVAADTTASVIGYFAGPCAKSASSGYLAVLNARTGQLRRWTGVAVYGSGGSVVTGTALSMSGRGSVVGFTGEATGPDGRSIGQRVWTLRTSASAGPLSAHIRAVLSRPNAGPALSAVVLSPDGKTFYFCSVTTKGTASAHRTVTQTAAITVRRTSSGTSEGTIAKLTAHGVLGEGVGCPMAMTPSGRYLLAPYSLRYASNTEVGPRVQVARIIVARRSVAVISFRLPGSAGMSVAIGVSIAW